MRFAPPPPSTVAHPALRGTSDAIELVDVRLSLTSTVGAEVTVRRGGRERVGSASGHDRLETVVHATLDAVRAADVQVLFGGVARTTVHDEEIVVVVLHRLGGRGHRVLVGSADKSSLDVGAAAEATVDALHQMLPAPESAWPVPHDDGETAPESPVGRDTEPASSVDRTTIAAHQIRSPLSTVIETLETLDVHADRLDGETSQQLVRRALAQSQRLMQRVDGVLGTGRQQGTGTAEVRAAILRAIFDAGASDVVEIDCPTDLATACPQQHLEEMIGILVTNAVEHGSPPVVVRARRAGDRVSIEVVDAGAGLPPHQEEAVLRGGVTTSEQGHGIGLVAARTLARSHGGDVAYVPDGRVSRFVITLPAAGDATS